MQGRRGDKYLGQSLFKPLRVLPFQRAVRLPLVRIRRAICGYRRKVEGTFGGHSGQKDDFPDVLNPRGGVGVT